MSHFAEPESAVSYARARWEDGEHRVQRFSSDSRRRAIVEDIIEAIVHELEKHIGSSFSTLELAHLQDRSEDWCQEIAHRRAPGQPWAWDLDMVQGAAFYRYARRAVDYQLASED